ncbi:MAG: amidohydrolase [Caulobacter sp.]|nr:amidohydrolase [Caulobacter sp.]
MGQFIFSADSHIREPNDLFTGGLPKSLQYGALQGTRKDGYIYTMAGEKVLHRLRLGDAAADIGRSARLGASDLTLRRQDMEADGIDGEICFPSLGLMLYFLKEPELELASAQLYNDWNNRFFSPHLDTFVRCGVLPVRRQEDTLAELKRIAGLGFTAAMLPVAIPGDVATYNSESWDPVFALAAELKVVLVFHTGTGLETFVAERGPGAAVINYSRQMNDGINTVMTLVAGGVLDRNPGAQICVIESGASWLAALAERMDEVYHAHNYYVQPKLSLLPSEIIRRQVKVSFQHDRACIMARAVTGTQALMFASDYPHMEGTFPHTRAVVSKLFDGIDISEQEKADILGGNAARLFRLARPEFAAAAA